MTMPAALESVILPLRQRWRTLPAGQQRIGAAGGVLLVVLLAYAFIWLPVMREHDRLVARLPQLQAQLKTIQAQAEELRRVNASPAPVASAGAAVDAAALQALFGSAARISATPERAFRITIARVPYAQLWDRLGEAMGRHGLQLKVLSLKPTADAGPAHEVTVDMLLGERRGGGGQ